MKLYYPTVPLTEKNNNKLRQVASNSYHHFHDSFYGSVFHHFLTHLFSEFYLPVCLTSKYNFENLQLLCYLNYRFLEVEFKLFSRAFWIKERKDDKEKPRCLKEGHKLTSKE